MNIEVETDELKYYDNKLQKSSETLDYEIKYWQDQIQKLKLVWSGTESEVFYRNIESYLVKLQVVAETTKLFSINLKKTSSIYEEKDTEFSMALQRENSQYNDDEIRSQMSARGLHVR